MLKEIKISHDPPRRTRPRRRPAALPADDCFFDFPVFFSGKKSMTGKR